MTSSAAPIEALLKRDRALVLGALAVVAALAWLYLIDMARMMPVGESMAGMRAVSWDLDYFIMMFVMWAIMMTGMMIPSAAPVILLHAAIQRRREGGRPYLATALFVLGYLVAWTGFSLAAVLLQWGLSEAALLSPAMVSTSSLLAGAVFLAAGLYQWTPLKDVCLKHCRSPVHFLVRRHSSGRFAPLRMGIEHGAYCVGCCWVLMLLLFALGVMNLIWVAAIAIFVLVEKVLPRGIAVGRLSGGLMIASGALLIASTFVTVSGG